MTIYAFRDNHFIVFYRGLNNWPATRYIFLCHPSYFVNEPKRRCTHNTGCLGSSINKEISATRESNWHGIHVHAWTESMSMHEQHPLPVFDLSSEKEGLSLLSLLCQYTVWIFREGIKAVVKISDLGRTVSHIYCIQIWRCWYMYM